MNSDTTNDYSSIPNSSQLSHNLQNVSMSSRRSSSRISRNDVPSPRNHSGVQRTISKTSGSRGTRRSSIGTPKSRRKNNEIIDISINTEIPMDFDGDSIDKATSERDQDQQQHLLDLSNASVDTVIVEDLNTKKKPEKRPIDYFLPTDDRQKVKCSKCLYVYKYDPFSDSNLRSHLGFKHGLHEYLFPSQIKQRELHEKKSTIPPHLKQQLDEAAIQCILKDGLSFGIFRRQGMQNFLNIIKPGYYGPSRQTVRKHIDKLYQQRRLFLKEKFKKIPYIALTTDVWINSRRYYFIVITAHYLDDYQQHFSDVISFRRFHGSRGGTLSLLSFKIKDKDK